MPVRTIVSIIEGCEYGRRFDAATTVIRQQADQEQPRTEAATAALRLIGAKDPILAPVAGSLRSKNENAVQVEIRTEKLEKCGKCIGNFASVHFDTGENCPLALEALGDTGVRFKN